MIRTELQREETLQLLSLCRLCRSSRGPDGHPGWGGLPGMQLLLSHLFCLQSNPSPIFISNSNQKSLVHQVDLLQSWLWSVLSSPSEVNRRVCCVFPEVCHRSVHNFLNFLWSSDINWADSNSLQHSNVFFKMLRVICPSKRKLLLSCQPFVQNL